MCRLTFTPAHPITVYSPNFLLLFVCMSMHIIYGQKISAKFMAIVLVSEKILVFVWRPREHSCSVCVCVRFFLNSSEPKWTQTGYYVCCAQVEAVVYRFLCLFAYFRVHFNNLRKNNTPPRIMYTNSHKHTKFAGCAKNHTHSIFDILG